MNNQSLSDQFDNEIDLDSAFEKEQEVEAEYTPPSMGEAALRGAAQGATFGFADEAEAGLRSLKEDRPYKEVLNEVRSEYDIAEREQPVASLLGNIGGGVVTGGALSSLAKLKSVSSLLKGAGSLGKAAIEGTKVEKALQKSPAIAKTLEITGKGAAAGVIPGALYGAGTAEEEDTLEAAKSGALTGAITGGVLSGAGQAVKETGKKLADVPFISDAVKAFQYGKEGQGLITKSSTEQIEKNLSKQTKNIAEKADKTTSALSQLKSITLELADNDPNTHTVNRDSVADTIEGLAQRIKFSDDISTQEKTRLLSLADDVRKLPEEMIKPSDANAIRQQLQSFTPMGSKTMSSKQGRDVSLALVDELASYRKSIPETYLDQALEIMKKQKDGQKMSFDKEVLQALKNISKEKQGAPLEKIDDSLSTLQTFKDEFGISKLPSRRGEPTEYDVEKLNTMVSRLSKETESGSKARRQLERAPKLLERAYGKDSEGAMKKLSEAGELYELSRKARGQEQAGNLGGVVGLGRTATVATSNILGQSYGGIEKVLKFPTPVITGLSDKLKSSNTPASNALAKKFDELANMTDEGKKKALMNTLLQSPAYRQELNKLLGREEE
jgi:hypothetical protein